MANTAAFQWFPPEKRAFPSALVTSGSSFAKIAVAPMLALVVAAWGWHAGFVTMAIASFVWCALWLAIGKQGPYARRSAARKPGNAATDSRKPGTMVRVPLRNIFLTKSVIGALIGTFTVYGLVAASITFIPSFFETGLGYSQLQSGFMFGLPSIGALIMMFGATFISDRLSSRGHSARATRALTTTAFLVVGGIALATLPLIGAPAIVVAVLVLGYGCASVALPMMNAVVAQIAPAQQLSGTLGIFLAIQNLSGLIAPVTVGILVDRAATPQAGYSLAYQIFGLAILIGALAIFLLVHPERDAARVQAQLATRQSQATVRA
jgi:MFS family permease